MVGAAVTDAFLHLPMLLTGIGGQVAGCKQVRSARKRLDGGDGLALAAARSAMFGNGRQSGGRGTVGFGAGCIGQGRDGLDDREGHTSTECCTTGPV